ncbi:hypothetical protein [Croceimicrobium hydrocarbonivorans]|uniref:Lipoprotein n=1 Tax=Croceimicrobium hydrocarbonivorans TaxID=2761580 RepID=A0A7H0VHH2_9FLAO|nr:hypothetical protein [Croceimicrobium hydrocarbonivorans]QNR25170.1 hypothetical protein H4K34_04845 [Croceimicrobium hydrocarbonivorans]
MKSNKTILLLSILVLTSCQRNQSTFPPKEFKYPKLFNSQILDSIQSTPFEAKRISEVFPIFIGKFKYQDSIDVNPLNIDSTQINNFIQNDLQNDWLDSLDINGLELLIDPNTSVPFSKSYNFGGSPRDYFPVYFVNSTNKDKVFYGKDGHVFGIQEAKEKRNQWHPIEVKGYDFCGNGRWAMIIHPQEFVVVLMQKYQGDYETEIRSRFKIGENIFVSKPYEGSIFKSQFSLPDSSYLLRTREHWNKDPSNWYFYGAHLKEYED